MQIEPIGVVHTTIAEAVDDNWGEVISEIHLIPDLAAGLNGLDDFSHLLIIFWMHQASFNPATDLQRHPRGRADLPKRGIFAQRAKHRPNPIGITAVKLLGVDGPIVRVEGLDAIDGTPVLDIKPYVPAFDRVPDVLVQQPEWMMDIMRGYF
jgi:tRNA-Thr(GGU) m(6)t(6)A37 methyltransferase TsaA